MEVQRKLIVGCDLCEDFTQISCYSYKTLEPIPICQKEDEDNSLIPTVLCIKGDTRLWSFGADAAEDSKGENNILVDHLLERLKSEEEAVIFGEKYTAVALLEKFLRKTLTMIKNYFPTEIITKLVITLRDMEPKVVDGVYEALKLLGIEKDRAQIMSHASAYMYYALSQERSLWVNDVGLFDFNDKELSFYQISINRRANPMIAGLEKKEFTDMLNMPMLKKKEINSAYILGSIAETVLYKQIISTLYFTGRGFTGGWADETIKGLCMGRRVFIGQNLYCRGACYAANELSGDRKLGDIVLLNNEMLISSVWIKVYCDASAKEILLTDAAVPWYEVDRSIEVIPSEETDFEIIIKNIITKEIIRERLSLTNLPERPDRMTRLAIRLVFADRSSAKIIVMDLGFGDVYQGSGKTWEFTVNL